MGKKKCKPNAFSEFMFEFIERERRAGRRHSKEQWAVVARPAWEKLSADQKERYKQQAKTKPARTVYVPAKYTSQGIPLEQVEREQQALAEKKRYMERKIKNMVLNAFLDNDIKTKPFVFIMANYFYKDNSGLYSPAEIAAAQFNFENAIYKYYHTFVNPGTVAIGYAFEAKDRSEKIHRLPPPPDAMGEKDYSKIYRDILDVIGARPNDVFDKDDPRRPCVFIRKQDIEMIESILDQLSENQWNQVFDVFELELLFNELKNKVEDLDEPIRVSVTNGLIEQDRYDATPDISCAFHEEQDKTRHCSLSYVRRWFFLFADHICDKIGVKLVRGTHVPKNACLAPPVPFDEDDELDPPKPKFEDDHKDYSHVSSSMGYSKFQAEDDSSSDEDDAYF